MNTNEFKKAKEIAISIKKGCYRRATTADGGASGLRGYKDDTGRTWVIDDNKTMHNPDAIIDGSPARQVYDGFTIMQ